MRPPLVWSSTVKKEPVKQEQLQEKATIQAGRMERLSAGDQNILASYPSKKKTPKRLRGSMMDVNKCTREASLEEGEELLKMMDNAAPRTNGYEVSPIKFKAAN